MYCCHSFMCLTSSSVLPSAPPSVSKASLKYAFPDRVRNRLYSVDPARDGCSIKSFSTRPQVGSVGPCRPVAVAWTGWPSRSCTKLSRSPSGDCCCFCCCSCCCSWRFWRFSARSKEDVRKDLSLRILALICKSNANLRKEALNCSRACWTTKVLTGHHRQVGKFLGIDCPPLQRVVTALNLWKR